MPRTQSLIIPALIIFTFVAGAPILGCSTSKENKSASAGGLIVEGKKQMKLDSPEEAKAAFQRVLEEYPDSKERITASVGSLVRPDSNRWSSAITDTTTN